METLCAAVYCTSRSRFCAGDGDLSQFFSLITHNSLLSRLVEVFADVLFFQSSWWWQDEHACNQFARSPPVSLPNLWRCSSCVDVFFALIEMFKTANICVLLTILNDLQTTWDPKEAFESCEDRLHLILIATQYLSQLVSLTTSNHIFFYAPHLSWRSGSAASRPTNEADTKNLLK